jgi:glycerophosphoryl diester phosphodiesterase
VRIYGHRGAQGEAPESTIPGFRHAIALGLDAVEFDVQLTADNHLVVIHDATLDRTTNGTGPVANLTLAELQALDARAQFPDWPEPCTIPTLADVFDVVGQLPALLVEIKRDTPDRLDVVVPAVIDLVRQRNLTGQVTLSSFDPYALELAAQIAPEIPRIINGAWREPGTRERAIAAGVTGTDFDYKQVGREHLDWARSNNLWIIAWPCHTEEAFHALQAFDIDDVGSDCPSRILPLVNSPSQSRA